MTAPSRAWFVPAVLTGTVVPFGVLAYRAASGRLGPDPVATALNQLGLLALTLLVASLLATPTKLLTGAKWPLKVRKLLGLAAFFAALLHVAVYVGLDQGFDWRSVTREVVSRPFLAAGFAAVAVMTPLALTSTKRSVQRLGPQRWRNLHRLAYAAGVLGVVHYVLRVKTFPTEPALYGVVLGASFAVRVVVGRRPRST